MNVVYLKKLLLNFLNHLLIHELLKENKVQTTKQANYLIEIQDPDALAALEKVIQNKYVLLK
jgi:hypothetical protein